MNTLDRKRTSNKNILTFMILFAAILDHFNCDIETFQKRAANVFQLNPIALRFVKSGRNKWPSFSAWGGKRSPEVADYETLLKRASWTGRKLNIDVKNLKRKFNAWKGRRSSEDDILKKRRQFNLLGGKRSNI